MRRVLLMLLVSLTMIVGVVVGVSVAAAPGIRVQTTRAGVDGLPVPVLPVVTRRGELQPPLGVPGQYMIVVGEGFAPNTPVTATLSDGTHSIPLVAADVQTYTPLAAPLVTDANGAVPVAAFMVPPAAELTGRNGTLVIAAGQGTVAGTPVVLDVPLPNETAGDTLVIGFAVLFYAAAALAVLLLVRRLPRYPGPVRRETVREADAT